MATAKKRISFKVLTSFSEVVKDLFRPRFTIPFPVKSVQIPDQFRGAPVLNDVSICIACGSCERNCPSHCITMEIINEETKEYNLTFNLAQCLYCGVCAENCSKNAISMSSEWLLANDSKDSLIRIYHVRRPIKKKPVTKRPGVQVVK